MWRIASALWSPPPDPSLARPSLRLRTTKLEIRPEALHELVDQLLIAGGQHGEQRLAPPAALNALDGAPRSLLKFGNEGFVRTEDQHHERHRSMRRSRTLEAGPDANGRPLARPSSAPI